MNEDITSVNFTVTRAGDPSVAVTVDYATSDGTANERGDYTTALGTIRFAAGQTEAVVPVLISDPRTGACAARGSGSPAERGRCRPWWPPRSAGRAASRWSR